MPPLDVPSGHEYMMRLVQQAHYLATRIATGIRIPCMIDGKRRAAGQMVLRHVMRRRLLIARISATIESSEA